MDCGNTEHMSCSDIGLSEWTVKNCKIRRVQQHCIPKVIEDCHVIGIDETGSGKTAAFALPILQRLTEHPKPFGVFALVLTPTRELAIQLADQFLALGFSPPLSLTVVDSRGDTKQLLAKPHLVIATPSRLKVLLQDYPEIAPIFATIKVIMIIMYLAIFFFHSQNWIG